jgi:hypothetical protein
MTAISAEEGLALGIEHVNAFAPLSALYVRCSKDASAAHWRWDLPQGNITLMLGFDVERRGAVPRAVLTPRARITASIGAHIVDATAFATFLPQVVAAGQGAEARMRAHEYALPAPAEPPAEARMRAEPCYTHALASDGSGRRACGATGPGNTAPGSGPGSGAVNCPLCLALRAHHEGRGPRPRGRGV